jgi:LCP family protein required for cell wall assembly
MRGTSWIAVILVIAVGSAVGIAAGTFMAVYLPMIRQHGGFGQMWAPPWGGERYVRILMIGEDNSGGKPGGGHGLSDTLVVMAIDTQTREVRLLSIPRDTRVDIPGHGACKINAANSYGGPQLARRTVTDLLGVPINYYVATTTTGLRRFVDLVGGVYIVVEKDMHYTDRRQKLYIDLHASPQKQLLNGQQAEGYVRFRHDAVGDSGFDTVNGKKVPAGRTVRQQYFMRALANRILSLPTKRERMQILDTVFERKYVVSDLNLKDWEGLADLFKDIKPETIDMAVLPGAPSSVHGASYWLPDTAEVPKVVSRSLLFQELPAKVEVLNGSGVSGAAGRVADQLRQAGFEVERTDNAPKSDYGRSMVITHKGKTEPAQRIAKLLRCDDIVQGRESKDGIDITVIVGRNYTE